MAKCLTIAALLLTAGCSVPPIAPGSLPRSDHFDGQHFFNPDGRQGGAGEASKSPLALIEEELNPPYQTWPESVPVTPSRPPARVAGEKMLVTWIGHSTVLVQTQGLNILTDPVWAQRASPLSFAGPKRVRQPGVRLGDLPHIDLVLISHDHYDHLDTTTLGRLWRRDRPLIVTGLENDRLLARYDIKAVARDWGQSVAVRPGIKVIVERAHHWSAHGPGDHNRSLWCGFTITLPGGNIYYAGDTGPGDMKWAPEARQAGPVRLALLPIGAYHFGTGKTDNHIGPDQAVTAFRQLGAAYALGVHWGTFELTSEGLNQPRDRLSAVLAQERIDAARFRATEAGAAWTIPSLPQ
jgi:L-ascorbate metabolism protein UlaG (beta-lactamase superfamily)